MGLDSLDERVGKQDTSLRFTLHWDDAARLGFKFPNYGKRQGSENRSRTGQDKSQVFKVVQDL